MSVAIISSGFLLGLAGSLHCLGMCGPLSWALPIRHVSKKQQAAWLSIYQMGRITSYGLLGLIVGSLGSALRLTGFQQYFSIAIGAAILFFGTIIMAPHWAGSWKPLQYAQQKLNQWIHRTWNKPMNSSRMYLLGSLNGWLPCGMVYLALFTGMTLPSIAEAGLLMIFFGMGTVPAMMSISLSGHWVGQEIRVQLRRVVPVTVSIVGLVLILRGLNLGIPYVSPELPTGTLTDPIDCAVSVHR